MVSHFIGSVLSSDWTIEPYLLRQPVYLGVRIKIFIEISDPSNGWLSPNNIETHHYGFCND